MLLISPWQALSWGSAQPLQSQRGTVLRFAGPRSTGPANVNLHWITSLGVRNHGPPADPGTASTRCLRTGTGGGSCKRSTAHGPPALPAQGPTNK
ncbi:hypothetical protein NDU88_004876 [Pleurodeles waltl]|uniref:Uncharacterized protein n=1 Tax=Pleurodeles waltl TaxID=8319 RepID=A0AAV7RGY7_PLEWA|nr:hypothetical protein NDU88_004876 [Pleurodeles waltl]